MKEQTQIPQSMVVITPRRGSSLGLASIILGILALLICWVPFLNMLGLPLSGLGLILGGCGLLIAVGRKGSGIGFPIAGTMICGLALCVAFAINNAVATGLINHQQAAAQARKAQNATNQEVATPKATTPAISASAAPRVATPQPPASALTPSPTATPQEESWAPSDQPVKQGEIMVKVVGARVGKITLGKDFSGQPQVSPEPQLWIQLQIGNASKAMKHNYKTWAGRDFAVERDYATLSDNFGNHYKRVDFGLMDKPVGRGESASIYPNRYITDLLVFEPPVANVQYLNLELPARNFGGTGMLRIRIPWHSVPTGR